jgi:tetratricopeptide (TPR) repeat protein
MNQRLISPCIMLVLAVFLTTAVMPQTTLAQTSKGISLCNSWEFQKAETVLRDALKANPQDIQANYYLGMALLMQDKHEEALKTFLKVSADADKPGRNTKAPAPDNYEIQIALARTHLELKQNAEALKNLEAANKIHPNSLQVCTYRGLYYINLKSYQKAIVELEKAISLDKKDAYAHFYAGYAYLYSGDPARAVDEYKTFMQLAPQAPDAVKAKSLITGLC